METRDICSICHKNNVSELHHIVPVSKGGKDTYFNLIGICRNCHNNLHRLNISKEELLHFKKKWKNENQMILSEIILKYSNNKDLANQLARNYYKIKNIKEKELLLKRLELVNNAGELFNNYARIKHHIVKKVVDSKGNCVTDEIMTFYPLIPQKYRVFHIRGDGPASISEVDFKCNVKIRNREIKSENSILLDCENFKSFKVEWPKFINPGTPVMIRIKYFWPKTWNLMEDYYSYDILSWIENLEYDFTIKGNYEIQKVKSSLLNFNMEEIEYKSDLIIEKNSFNWKGSFFPLFSSLIIKYINK